MRRLRCLLAELWHGRIEWRQRRVRPREAIGALALLAVFFTGMAPIRFAVLLVVLGSVTAGCSNDSAGSTCGDNASGSNLLVDGGGAPDGAIPSCSNVPLSAGQTMQGSACNELCKNDVPHGAQVNLDCRLGPICSDPPNGYLRSYLCHWTCP